MFVGLRFAQPQPTLAEAARANGFPYVNGGLFSGSVGAHLYSHSADDIGINAEFGI